MKHCNKLIALLYRLDVCLFLLKTKFSGGISPSDYFVTYQQCELLLQLVIVVHFSLSESIKVTRDSIAASSLLETGQIPDGWLPTDSGLYIPSHFSYGFSCVLGLIIKFFVWSKEPVVKFIFFVL